MLMSACVIVVGGLATIRFFLKGLFQIVSGDGQGSSMDKVKVDVKCITKI